MLFASASLIAALLAAPGEIYRCPGPEGGSSFQDRPCAGATAARSQDRLAAGDDPRALREWLARFQHPAAGTPAAGGTAHAGAARSAATEPVHPSPFASKTLDEHQLAVCSERFYVCADGDSGRMDDCVARMARCGAGQGSACCPPQTLACYRDLRASGSTPAAAVRGALLGPGSACGP